jgi:hypothetical protein
MGHSRQTNQRNPSDLIETALSYSLRAMLDATGKARGTRRINWINVSTVISAAILIAAEVFGAAFAGEYGTYILQVLFFALGIAVMVAFIRAAMRVEPFTTQN